jgi:hypothetical protein
MKELARKKPQFVKSTRKAAEVNTEEYTFTMTTLTLQSISAAGSQQPQTLAPANQTRVAEASALAGVKLAENERRAQATSAQFQEAEKRSHQIGRKRAEGGSAGREADDDQTEQGSEEKEGTVTDPARGSYHRTA